jgi:hypothetical protein
MASGLKEIEKAVETTIDNARGPVDNYFDVVQRAFGLNPWHGTDLVDKMQRIVTQNVHANFEFVSKLTRAKDFSDVMQAHSQYVQSQLSFFSEEMKAVKNAYEQTSADLKSAA